MQAEGIAALFVAQVAAAVARPDAADATPYPQEVAAVANALSKRRQEFFRGRSCARDALARLGVAPTALPVAADRLPVWPVGYVGSISHSSDFCCAVAASRQGVLSLGVDVEDGRPLGDDLLRLVCRPDELAAFSSLPALVGCDWPKVTFSAKEAFYKAYYPVARSFLDFLDVSLRLEPEALKTRGSFIATICSPHRPLRHLDERIVGRWAVVGGRVYAGATMLRARAHRPFSTCDPSAEISGPDNSEMRPEGAARRARGRRSRGGRVGFPEDGNLPA